MDRLWYEQPATVWEEALPLGNGRMGAMIFGDPVNEQIQLNEDSMWYGGPVDRINPDTKEYLPRIRELILQGEIRKAERLMKMAMSGCPDSAHPYQTLGNIHFLFENIGEVTAYTRSLDLKRAVYESSFTANEIRYTRELFISAPDDVMVMRLTADKKNAITFQALLRREKFFDGIKKCGNNGICLYGNLGKGGFDFAMQLSAFPIGGSVCVIGEHLLVEEADEVILVFCSGTTYRMKDLEKELADKIQKAAAKPYEKLFAAHTEDYGKLFDRVEFSLGDLSAYDALPTDERIRRAAEGTVDAGLAKLYFDFGRYLLISCSREGTLAATLQGIWNKDMLPPWDCKFTININTQMNYWPAENCNLSECHMPLFELIKNMVEKGRETAQRMYGCRGFMCHHNTDIWGDTVTQDHWIPGSYWVMGAAWLCTHQWTHFEYTQDMDFLKEHFPIMREAALFFLDYMIEDDGYLKTCPSVSPENTFILPSGERGSNTAGVTMDNQILRDLFTQCIKAAELLGVEDELNEQLKAAREKLVPTQIGEKGNILEWPVDYEEAEPGHRHISHLYGLHPSEQITMDGTPELAKAARVTLERRLSHGGGHTGWSRAWIMNHYAKLWDGETAYYNFEQLMAKSTLPNLFDNHPPFQIDGNFGATAAIAEMLVQSTSERIVLLPALPKAWKEGSMRGLCVKGGAEFDIAWKDGKLTKALLRANQDICTKVRFGEQIKEVSLKAGEEQEISFS
ncbi:MAG: glycoside hydrolase family 95 protein [Lachnospiraceae bacterium]|nr:glycoside hydrolase family 95 protein [Lachnospiraceae bacterium]